MKKKIIFNREKKSTNDDDDLLISDLQKEDDLIQTNSFTSTEYIINLDSDIISPDHYRKIFKILKDATQYDMIRFKINTNGGNLDSFVEFYHHLMICPAPAVAEIHQAYSAGSLIAMSCDAIELNEFSSMMIHTVSGGMAGKAEEIESYSKFITGQNKQIFYKVYEGFLSPTEMEDVFKGQDLWLCSKDIEKRLKNWTPIKERVVVKKEKKSKKKVEKCGGDEHILA